MNIDFSVIVIKDDGTRVLTNVIEPDDVLEGGASYEEIVKRHEDTPGGRAFPTRTDADLSDEEKKPAATVAPEEGTTPDTDLNTEAEIAHEVAPKKAKSKSA